MDPRAIRVPIRARVRARSTRETSTRSSTSSCSWTVRSPELAGRRGGVVPHRTTASSPICLPSIATRSARMTVDKTLPKIRDFVEKGGTVLAIGSSATNLAAFLKLLIESHLVENGTALPRTKFYVPGSVLSAKVDVSNQSRSGCRSMRISSSTTVPCSRSRRVVRVKPIAWFDSKTPLRSGWAWGQSYLENGVVVAAEAKVGDGKARCSSDRRSSSARSHTARSSSCSTGSIRR